VKGCGTGASPSLSAFGGDTGLMGGLAFASGERAMTGETGAAGIGAGAGAGAASGAGTGSSPGMVTLRRNLSFALAARKSVL